jgi:hypothetical protein
VTDNSGYILGYGTVGGDVIGDGFIIGPSGGTLEIEGSLSGSVVYGYPYTPSTLKLDRPAEFTGSLNYISVGDTLDLVGITANSGVYNGSTLTINETNGQHLDQTRMAVASKASRHSASRIHELANGRARTVPAKAGRSLL